jgi:hypothetical protein
MGYGNRTNGYGIKTEPQNQIDHIAIVIDESSSMDRLQSAVIRVVDNQIAYLARRSKELNREVRVSVYTFNSTVSCRIFDKDVLRLPSIADIYRPGGMTALVDATLKSQEDLATTSTIYGDHAFLTFVVTDGQENRSRNVSATLSRVFETQPENYTVAILVPDHQSADEAARWGFPQDNIRPWDATSVAGVEAAGSTINTATENFFSGRAKGQRGSRSIFSTGSDAVNTATVKSTLAPLAGDKYRLIPVMPEGVTKDSKVRVDKFIKEDCGMTFQLGTVYYQWNKREKVQPQKRLAVVEKKTDKVYVGTGDEIRQMIGLPDMSVTQKATPNPDYDVFVQSTAPNRNLVPFTKVLVML